MIDLVPTMLAAAGARQPDDLPGLDLLDHLTSGEKIKRKAIFGEGFAHDIAHIENPEASLLYRWCIRGKWKLLLTYDGQLNRYASTHPRAVRGQQLYNLKADPTESSNVAAEHSKTVARLAKRIEGWYPLEKAKLLTTTAQPATAASAGANR